MRWEIGTATAALNFQHLLLRAWAISAASVILATQGQLRGHVWPAQQASTKIPPGMRAVQIVRNTQIPPWLLHSWQNVSVATDTPDRVAGSAGPVVLGSTSMSLVLKIVQTARRTPLLLLAAHRWQNVDACQAQPG